MTDPRGPAPSALIVDDEHDIRELLVLTLGRMALRTATAATVAMAKARPAQNRYALCLTDRRLTDGEERELIGPSAAHHPDTPVAMLPDFGNVEGPVEAVKAGAF